MGEVSASNDADRRNVAPGAQERPININSLFPPEILVGVFDILHSDIMQSLPFPLPHDEGLQKHPLGDFMLVCRGWYNLIQTTPTYWTFIDIGALHHTAGESEKARAVRSFGPEGVIYLKRRLEKSGSLPLYVTVAPEYIQDFTTVLDILKGHARRLETINIVKMPHLKHMTLHHTSPEQLLQLLQLPLPLLKRLQVDRFRLEPLPPPPWVGRRVEIDAPQLNHLSSHLHVLIPHDTSQLISLSMSGIGILTFQSTLTQGQVQLPKLLYLRIADCETGLLLSTLSTPLLQVLVCYLEARSVHVPEDLPEYPHLKDLQWSDVGPDPTFELLFRRCPNLTRYANYVIGKEVDLNINLIVEGPTILTTPGGINSIKWPNLEEVLFDSTTYASLRQLVDAVPTIKRIRTLRDPVEDLLRYSEDEETERTYLSELREKVDVVVWLDPWTNG